jgi:phosphohistidine swiveling domain-containing protein
MTNVGGDPLQSHTAASTWWTTTNLNEAIPGVATPLTWTFWYLPTERNIRRVFHRFGVLGRRERAVPEAIDNRFVAVFCGRPAANLNVFRATADRMPGTSGQAYEEQFFGAVRSDVVTTRTRRRYPAIALRAPTIPIGLARRVRRERAQTDRWWREIVFGAPPPDPGTLLLAAQQRFEAAIYAHGLATSVVQALYERVARACGRAGQAAIETTVLGGFGAVEESGMVGDLWRAATGALAVDEVVRRHGFHGPNEGELSTRVWREHRAALDELVASYRDLPDPAEAEPDRKTQREQAERELLRALPRRQRAPVRMLLRSARRFVPLRETGKASFLQTLDVARYAARHLGSSLVAAGVLDAPDDVFFLTVDEVSTASTRTNVREIVASRRSQRAKYQGVDLPAVWKGEPQRDVARPPDISGGPGEDHLSGIGVQSGVVEGRVRVVRGADGFADLARGEILVCHATDPGWTALFPIAAAVVIDVGGTMSHGAIVAREFGVPCVVNTGRGTEALSTGELVRVDGGTGEVLVLERAEGGTQ